MREYLAAVVIHPLLRLQRVFQTQVVITFCS